MSAQQAASAEPPTGASSQTEPAKATIPSAPQDPAETPVPRAPGESLVRIVRLSQQHGLVQLDRNTGQGLERAVANMPIVQGVRLRTEDGLAEVEFEDNSSLRLTPGTEVSFPHLSLLANGVKVSTMRVAKGSVYLSLAGSRDNDLSVTFADQTLTLSPSSHVHLFVGAPVSRLVVFSGEAKLQGPNGTVSVTKKQTLTLDAGRQAPPLIAKGLVDDPYDKWDKNEVDYQKRYTVANSFAGSPYGYGLADLNYYGSFSNASGCGQMWQPYFVGAGWSPYNAGLWTWYPGAGYSWVSLYPWGWTPFHSGDWSFCQGRGWGWRPSGGWNGVQNLRKLPVTRTPGGAPIKPPPPPRPRQPTTVLSLAGSALPVSGLQPTGEFRFRGDSAGLGVPRGAFNGLGKISRGVEQHGSVARAPSEHVISAMSAAQPTSARTWAASGGGAPIGSSSRSGASVASSSHASANSSSHASSSPSFSSAGHSGGGSTAAPSGGGSSHK